ncbi:MAG TPA: HAMP domain-containing sensor histidine kinase [Gemmatimonadales bacterium]|nr:HAMP domain-containing sensor histidine kinase [Gemmatimonadales bacterium]
MSFRTRILIGFAAVVLVPLAVFGLRVRAEMASRLTAEYQRRVATLAAVIRADLARGAVDIARRLAALSAAIADDNRFRQAALEGGDRRYLLDYAGAAMRSAGLSLLQIQDEQGRIVSSGHFRNEYDRLEPALPRLVAASQSGIALVRVRTAEAPLLAIARVDSVRLGTKRFTVVGGLAVDSAFLVGLSPDSELSVSVVLPGDSVAQPGTEAAVVSEVSLPFVLETDSAATLRPARIVVSHSLASLVALRHGVDLAFLAAVVLAGAIALLLGSWMSLRISRPLTALARKTAEIDVDRLDVAFESDRADEIGALTRLLAAMTERLRAGAARLREAERRIAIGDLARQVNHDIKNGLTPIRNVFRHLAETAANDPDRLAAVYRERQGNVESSISYLENLAANYARLYPEPAATACDVGQVIRDTIARLGTTGPVELRTEMAERLPLVRADQLVLRRILENLVGNAVDSLAHGAGTVTVSAATGAPADGRATVRLIVADTGKGMTKAELDRAFDGFYSTKPGGTGLGLSIVRRLVLDANGVLRVETQPGAGTRFIIDLPADGGRA